MDFLQLVDLWNWSYMSPPCVHVSFDNNGSSGEGQEQPGIAHQHHSTFYSTRHNHAIPRSLTMQRSHLPTDARSNRIDALNSIP